ncbi:unnamed protein product [Dibothriocephalus latus]|uniref:Alpha-1,2-Mannosidase n=1 Tax=Dibothriocephalus latus TaxID=60516 RepID=A0A3P6TZM7_DIBLA|nr:unnamed protein product [Dibothriocephalus latus]
MESFFLSETTKYLYLLFDTDNFLHTVPSEDRVSGINSASPSPTWASSEQLCEPESGGYIFNTEAHPLDSSLIHLNTMAAKVGSEEWLSSLWQDMSGILMLSPSEEKYPPGYVPPLMRRSPPLMTCPNIPFSVQLMSFQDLDTVDLR